MDKELKNILLTILLIDVAVVVLSVLHYGGKLWLS